MALESFESGYYGPQLRSVINRNFANLEAMLVHSAPRPRELMASPPTPTVSTIHTISSPRYWAAVGAGASTAGRLNPLFIYRKTSRPIQVSPSYPGQSFVTGSGTDYGAARQQNIMGVPLQTDASEIEFFVFGNGAKVWLKVDGKYMSLTPTTITNDGNLYYYYVSFGSSAFRELELIGTSVLRFGGVYTPASATVMAAPARGPRTIVMADSFGEPTGADNDGIEGWITVMADLLGWDDVRPSAVGSSGILNPGTSPRLKWRDRIDTDVIPYAPQVLIIQGSINDVLYDTTANLAIEAAALVDALRVALPLTTIVMTSIMPNKGGGYLAPSFYDRSAALRDVATSAGIPFIDLLERRTAYAADLTTTTLASSAAANATSLSVVDPIAPGSTFRFPDNTHVFVKTIAGGGPFTATIDTLANAQASGAVLTPVGNTIMQGNGRVGATTGNGNADLAVSSDSVHPSTFGHSLIGNAMAYELLNL